MSYLFPPPPLRAFFPFVLAMSVSVHTIKFTLIATTIGTYRKFYALTNTPFWNCHCEPDTTIPAGAQSSVETFGDISGEFHFDKHVVFLLSGSVDPLNREILTLRPLRPSGSVFVPPSPNLLNKPSHNSSTTGISGPFHPQTLQGKFSRRVRPPLNTAFTNNSLGAQRPQYLRGWGMFGTGVLIVSSSHVRRLRGGGRGRQFPLVYKQL